jgi:hypothetical protein
MRGSLAALAAVLACAPGVQASNPGEPLGPEDWVFNVPGLQATSFAGLEDGFREEMNAGQVYDNEGRLLTIRTIPYRQERCGGPGLAELNRTELVAWTGSGDPVVLGYLDDRCGAEPSTKDAYRAGGARNGVVFDPVNGVLSWLGMYSCEGCSSMYDSFRWDSIRGLTTLFDVIDSFSPGSQKVGFRRPLRPEGLRDADRFDTYWGDVTRSLDLSDARPLQCAYPGHWPQPGEYLSFPDVAPNPSPGQAVYYLTSVTYQGETRAGRTATAGRLVARDARRLPECALRGGGDSTLSGAGTTAPSEASLAKGH